MTNEAIIKACAELDGWTEHGRAKGIYFKAGHSGGWIPHGGEMHTKRKEMKLPETSNMLPDYLTSYDAIIPLIQKQTNSEGLKSEFILSLTGETHSLDFYAVCGLFHKDPTQLCEALLRATGKWTE